MFPDKRFRFNFNEVLSRSKEAEKLGSNTPVKRLNDKSSWSHACCWNADGMVPVKMLLDSDNCFRLRSMERTSFGNVPFIPLPERCNVVKLVIAVNKQLGKVPTMTCDGNV